MPKCVDCKKSYGFMELNRGICKSCLNIKQPQCHRCKDRFNPEEVIDNYCFQCHEIEASIKQAKRQDQARMEQNIQAQKRLKDDSGKILRDMLLTTESMIDLPIKRRLDIVSSEYAINMTGLGDIDSSSFVGGRSNKIQEMLRSARHITTNELKKEAYILGGNAVVGVDYSFNEISGGDRTLFFLVATGTAVELTETTID